MRILSALSILIVFVLLSAVHLTINTNNMATGYKIDALKKTLEVLRNENRYLNYLVAKEEALPRIENFAKGKLNMVYPDKINYIVIPSKEAE